MAPPIKTHTLDTLRERCDEEGACLIWRGFYNNQGIPMVYAAHPATSPGRSGKNVSVRWLTALLAGDAAAQAKGQPVIAGKEAAEIALSNYAGTRFKGYKRLEGLRRD